LLDRQFEIEKKGAPIIAGLVRIDAARMPAGPDKVAACDAAASRSPNPVIGRLTAILNNG
jgi:hypothetical protein